MYMICVQFTAQRYPRNEVDNRMCVSFYLFDLLRKRFDVHSVNIRTTAYRHIIQTNSEVLSVISNQRYDRFLEYLYLSSSRLKQVVKTLLLTDYY